MTEPARFRSFEEFRAGQFEIARGISGASRGDWNGEYDYTPFVGRDRRVLGASLSDGTILYDQMYVEDPLRDAFDNTGRTRTIEERQAIRDALKSLFHEDNHLVARDGSRPRREAFQTNRDPGVREIEEGVTEAYSYRRLDRFISATGFDEIVPGIHEVRGQSTYPDVAPAAEELARGIGERTALGTDEVLDRLNRVDHEEKWDVATDLMYESSDLPGMVAEDRERDAAKARLRAAMRDRFVGLRHLRASEADGRTEHDVRTTSIEAGRDAIADANAEIDRMERSYRETGRILDDRSLDRTTDQDRAATEQPRTSTEQDRATPEQAPPDPPTQQDRLDLDPSLDPSRWAPPTAESRITHPRGPVDRATEVRDAADRAAEVRDLADRAADGRDRADRNTDSRDAADRATGARDAADRDAQARDAADRAAEGRDPAGRATGLRDAADHATDPRDPADRAADRATDAYDAADRATGPRDAVDQATEPSDRAERDADVRYAADRAVETRDVADRAADRRDSAEPATGPRESVDRAADARESVEVDRDGRVGDRGDRDRGVPQRDGAQRDQGARGEQRGQGAQRAAAAARNAAYAADAVVEEADPTSSGSRRGRARQGPGGSDAISRLRDLTHGGQRPASEAARTPGEHPQARHHGRGVHSPAQHNQRLRDQHRPQRDQGEGIER
jgi:hypothetical protein